MHISIAALILAVASTIVATPISPLHGLNAACYYKRDIDAYVRRDASNSEILCGKVKQQQNKRTHNIALASEVIDYETSKEKRGAAALGKVHDDSGTYKRHHVAQNKVDTSSTKRHHIDQDTAEASTTDKRHHIAQNTVQGSTSEKRHHIAQNKVTDESETYKRHHASEDETTEANKRVPPADNACYYKRDLVTGELIALKRDAGNSEILCG